MDAAIEHHSARAQCHSTRRALLAAAGRRGPAGVMVHHALLDREEREDIERLLALLAAHENARCVPLGSLVDA
jgi:hypothetical protein